MALDIRPATAARFDDLAAILAPRRAGAQGCWCLGWRLRLAEDEALRGAARADEARRLARRRAHAPGVLAYDDDGCVGWAAVSPRAELVGRLADGPPLPDDPETTWSIVCFRVRAGHGGRGVATALLDGAVAYAAERGATAAEGLPVDAGCERLDRTLASVGTRRMFERAGFARVGEWQRTRAGRPQVLMRRSLR